MCVQKSVWHHLPRVSHYKLRTYTNHLNPANAVKLQETAPSRYPCEDSPPSSASRFLLSDKAHPSNSTSV